MTKLQEEMPPKPCPVCAELMHWCESCQEYHCNNSNVDGIFGQVCPIYVG